MSGGPEDLDVMRQEARSWPPPAPRAGWGTLLSALGEIEEGIGSLQPEQQDELRIAVVQRTREVLLSYGLSPWTPAGPIRRPEWASGRRDSEGHVNGPLFEAAGVAVRVSWNPWAGARVSLDPDPSIGEIRPEEARELAVHLSAASHMVTEANR